MANIKPLDKISEKWKRLTSAATGDYTDGINNPRVDWAAAAAGAEKLYATGVQQAVTRQSFSKGVKKAGTQKWQTNAVEKGAPRFSQGVAVSQTAYENGFSPYRNAIAALTLPPRGPKGDASNINRVTAVTNALHNLKLSRLGA